MTVLTYLDARDCDVEVFTHTLKTTGAIFVDYPEDLDRRFLREFPVPYFDIVDTKAIVFTGVEGLFKDLIKLDGVVGSGLLVKSGLGNVFYVFSSHDSHNFYLQFSLERRENWKFELVGMWPKSL